MRRALLGLVLFAVACAEEPPPPPPAPPPPPPLEILVTPWPTTTITGRLAAFDVALAGGGPTAAFEGGVTATLGGRRGVVVTRGAARRELLVLAPVHIDEEKRLLELRLQGSLSGAVPFVKSVPVPVAEGRYRTSKLRVRRRFVRPNRRQRRRAKRESARSHKVLQTVTPERLWDGPFARPVPTRQTSPFGTLRTLNGKRKSRHLGWDLDGNTGDPVKAAGRGRVALAARHFYSGGTLILDHGGGLYTLYFHLSRFEREVGDLVERDELIGRVGKSGRVTGPHLHFAVKVDDVYVDPKAFLKLRL